MQRLLHTPLALLMRRLLALYGILLLCRILFYAYNHALIGPIVWSEAGAIAGGSLRFDTRSILYADALFILLSLLPFEFCCSRAYQRLLCAYYAAVNFVFIIAANLADAVHFHYTHRRLAAPDLGGIDGDTLPALFRLAGENWPLLLAAAALLLLLMGCFGRCDRCESILNPGWSYYTLSSILFAGVLLLCAAGFRGGFARDARPLSPDDTARYTAYAGKSQLIQSNPFRLFAETRLRFGRPGGKAQTPEPQTPDAEAGKSAAAKSPTVDNRHEWVQDEGLHRLRQLHRAYDTDD